MADSQPKSPIPSPRKPSPWEWEHTVCDAAVQKMGASPKGKFGKRQAISTRYGAKTPDFAIPLSSNTKKLTNFAMSTHPFTYGT